jgi:hypothetical protein
MAHCLIFPFSFFFVCQHLLFCCHLLPSAVMAVLCPIKNFGVVVLSCQVSLQLNYRVRCIFMDGNFSDQQKDKHWLTNLAFWFRKNMPNITEFDMLL